MTSLRLRLYSFGARMFVRPLFSVADNPDEIEKRMKRMVRHTSRVLPGSLVLPRNLGGRPGLWVSAAGSDPSRVILYFHGGAYFAGSSAMYAALAARLSRYGKAPVFMQDYCLAPKHRFPAAFKDALSAWHDLIERGYSPERIIIGGDSAGGGLALAVLAHILARGEKPAGAFAFSPWTDLTMSGQSVTTNAAYDAVIPADRMQDAADLYLDGYSSHDPGASPHFAEFDDPPPVLLHVGSPEVLEDDSVRMAEKLRAAGGEVTFRKWENAPHVHHLAERWVPEARAALREAGAFIQTSFAAARR